MNCEAILCNELTESGSLFCGSHRESGESLYCTKDMEERLHEHMKVYPEGDVRDLMMMRFIPYWRKERMTLRGTYAKEH